MLRLQQSARRVAPVLLDDSRKRWNVIAPWVEACKSDCRRFASAQQLLGDAAISLASMPYPGDMFLCGVKNACVTILFIFQGFNVGQRQPYTSRSLTVLETVLYNLTGAALLVSVMCYIYGKALEGVVAAHAIATVAFAIDCLRTLKDAFQSARGGGRGIRGVRDRANAAEPPCGIVQPPGAVCPACARETVAMAEAGGAAEGTAGREPKVAGTEGEAPTEGDLPSDALSPLLIGSSTGVSTGQSHSGPVHGRGGGRDDGKAAAAPAASRSESGSDVDGFGSIGTQRGSSLSVLRRSPPVGRGLAASAYSTLPATSCSIVAPSLSLHGMNVQKVEPQPRPSRSSVRGLSPPRRSRSTVLPPAAVSSWRGGKSSKIRFVASMRL